MLTRSSNSVLDESNNGRHPCLETDFEMFYVFYLERILQNVSLGFILFCVFLSCILCSGFFFF